MNNPDYITQIQQVNIKQSLSAPTKYSARVMHQVPTTDLFLVFTLLNKVPFIPLLLKV